MAPQLLKDHDAREPQVTHNPQLAAQFTAGFRAPVASDSSKPAPPQPAPTTTSAPTHEEMS